MNKLNKLMLVLVAILFANTISAQTLDEGKKFIYYERDASAKAVLEKVVAANPNNEEAIYWLGQAMMGLEDMSGAKKLYLDRLAVSPNSPLILAGIGEIELNEGKTADSRSHFETAISLSKGTDYKVLNAVGHANANPESRNGNAAYAIEVLKKATQTKQGAKDPEVWTNLGDAYRKIADGSQAYLAYNAALAIDPNYARAIYRTGRIYQTQGIGQEPLYMKYYNDAIAKDPKYGPVYATLMNYYYQTDVTKSADYLDKWLNVSDNDGRACYSRASMKYAQGLFNDAITKADECITAEGKAALPVLYGLKALAYKRLNDSVNAKAMYEEYFARQSIDKIGSGDYASYATLLLKFPGNEAKAAEYIQKAVDIDTLEANKVSYLKQMAQAYEAKKDLKAAGDWYSKILDVKKGYNNLDIYNAAINYYKVSDYADAVKMFGKYTEKYPSEIFGYYMVAKSNSFIDSTSALGLAVPAYLKAVEVGEAAPDKSKVFDQLMGSYKYLMTYYYNTKKDQATALMYADKAIALDPADEQLKANREVISKNDPTKRPAAAPRPPAKPTVAPKTTGKVAVAAKPAATKATPKKK